MGKMNVPRIILGGVVAGILCFIGDGVVHGVLLRERWGQVMANLGRKTFEEQPVHMLYYAAYDLAKALVGVWLYAAIRPRFGPGPRTAAIAALVTWALVIPIALLGLIPSAFFGRWFALLWSIDGLGVMLIAIVIGAWLYREDDAAPAPAKT
jgi:hypothetical protein